MNKKARQLTSAMLLITSFSTLAEPAQYKHITELMDEYNDYPTYSVKGTDYPSFKVLSDKPLHIQISPRTMTVNDHDGLKYDSDRAAVYAAYRTLYQTPAQKVTITVIPLLIDTKTHKIEYLPVDKFKFSITKKQASNLLLKYSDIRNVNQLFTPTGNWSKQFENCCYLEDGNPGLSEFTRVLISQN